MRTDVVVGLEEVLDQDLPVPWRVELERCSSREVLQHNRPPQSGQAVMSIWKTRRGWPSHGSARVMGARGGPSSFSAGREGGAGTERVFGRGECFRARPARRIRLRKRCRPQAPTVHRANPSAAVPVAPNRVRSPLRLASGGASAAGRQRPPVAAVHSQAPAPPSTPGRRRACRSRWFVPPGRRSRSHLRPRPRSR